MVDREELIKRQGALAQFGDFVLRCDDLQAILTEGCRLIADALGTDLAKVVEIERDRNTGLVRAGIGWNEGVVGHARFTLDPGSSEAYAIEHSKPVVTGNIEEEKRFEFPQFMTDHGVVAIVNVPIFLPGGEPYGVLQVDARRPRDFGDEDIQFLRTYASVLGPLIDRLRQADELDHASARFRLIVENARDYAIFMSDADDIITDWFPGAAAIFGWSAEEIIGKPGAVIFTPEDQAAGLPAKEIEEAKQNGTAPNVRWHLRRDGSRVFIEGQVVRLQWPDGTLRGFIKIGQDVTERRRHEERQGVLLAELQHRVRNVLAMVRSLVNRGRDPGTVAEFRVELDGRIAAMARTQALLTRSAGAGVDLRGLVQEELAAHPFEEGRVSLDGPAVHLTAKAAEVLTLAVHELATNSIKYGALGREAGQLEIRWQISREAEADWLEFAWRERGVQIAPGPAPRKGFGTELITLRVPYELNGRGQIERRPDGICCTIAFPIVPGGSTLETEPPTFFDQGRA